MAVIIKWPFLVGGPGDGERVSGDWRHYELYCTSDDDWNSKDETVLYIERKYTVPGSDTAIRALVFDHEREPLAKLWSRIAATAALSLGVEIDGVG